MTTGDAQAIQREYYAKTALEYDDAHLTREPEHNIALRYISALLPLLSIRTVLDVGCGTGRGIDHLRKSDSGLRIVGIDPAAELLQVAIAKGIARTTLIMGDASYLPFPDGSLDAAMALGVLHHVPRPDLVVREMLRIANKAVFISDGNLFGQGARAARLAKFLLYKAGLWKAVKYAQTRGRGYFVTEGDGVAYSYSAYFQYGLLAQWGHRVISVPLSSNGKASHWPSPLFAERCVLLCAIRDLA